MGRGRVARGEMHPTLPLLLPIRTSLASKRFAASSAYVPSAPSGAAQEKTSMRARTPAAETPWCSR